MKLTEHLDKISLSKDEYFIRKYYTDKNGLIQGEETWIAEAKGKTKIVYICHWKDNKLHGSSGNSYGVDTFINRYHFEGEECKDEEDFKSKIIKKRFEQDGRNIEKD